jgi:hypothetical protein
MAGRTRTKTPAQPPAIPTNSLVASAVRYPGKSARIYKPSDGWQIEAYRHYGICGEARFAANYFGHALSKTSIFAATPQETPTGDDLVKAARDSTSAQAMKSLFNGNAGQTQMLTALGVHLTVAGDCYLVGRTIKPGEVSETGVSQTPGEEVWEVVSIQEMHVQGSTWKIKYGSGMNDIELGDNDTVIRVWRPHPQSRLEADSPFRSLLPVLEEIEWLTKHIFAQCSSRLAGAGILFMPQEMSFPPPPEVDGKAQVFANEADAFTMTLGQAMLGTLADPSLPSAHVPTVVTAPGEWIDKAHLMHFWTPLDEKALEMRQDAVYRFAGGMDLPREKVLGMSSNQGTGGGTSNGVSHWGAWQIDEDAITLHVEPMLELIVNALTIGYLRPKCEGSASAEDVVRYDTANLRLRPDRSKEAIELWDRMVLSTKAMLREVGFDESDMPDDDELKTRILMKIAAGSATPEQVAAAAAFFEAHIPSGETKPADEQPAENPPAPTLIDHPSRPRTPAEGRDAATLLAASEGLIYRALERAGNRLRNTVDKAPSCRSFETHTLIRANGSSAKVLEDAFSCAPEVLDGIADPAVVVPVLESYCHTLLAEQSPHERSRLSAWIESQMP